VQGLSENGWGKCEQNENIKDEEIQALFNMIDKDKSGSLSMRVLGYNTYFRHLGVFSPRKQGKLASS
jgi:hypothetical protein